MFSPGAGTTSLDRCCLIVLLLCALAGRVVHRATAWNAMLQAGESETREVAEMRLIFGVGNLATLQTVAAGTQIGRWTDAAALSEDRMKSPTWQC